jgi:sialate O-acetylesterase
MASAIDCGEELDIHPQDKKSVGYRLAQSALYRVYDFEDVVPNGPEICGAERQSDGSVKLSFNFADGLYVDPEKDQSFYVSADGVEFVPADTVEVAGNNVILRSDKLDWIFEVRYAWASFPSCTLYNGAGLPASSFRVGVEEA